jgi:hypothetical protein
MQLDETTDYKPQQLAETIANMVLAAPPRRGITFPPAQSQDIPFTLKHHIRELTSSPSDTTLLEDTSPVAQHSYFGDTAFLDKAEALRAALLKLEEQKPLSFGDKDALAAYPDVLSGLKRNWAAWVDEYRTDNRDILQGTDGFHDDKTIVGKNPENVKDSVVSAQATDMLAYANAAQHADKHLAPMLSGLCRKLGIQTRHPDLPG